MTYLGLNLTALGTDHGFRKNTEFMKRKIYVETSEYK
jgi:hypothetical protein